MANEKRISTQDTIYHVNTMKLHGEIRKAEWEVSTFEKDGKKVEVQNMKVRVLDDDDNIIELYDKNSEQINSYQRGQVGTFTLRLDMLKKFGAGNFEGKLLIIGFEED